jgi:hypothetical protein
MKISLFFTASKPTPYNFIFIIYCRFDFKKGIICTFFIINDENYQ